MTHDPQSEAYFDTEHDDGDPRNGDDEVPPMPGEADILACIIETEEQAAAAVDAINCARERLARIEESCKAMVKRAKGDVYRVEAQHEDALKRWAAKELEGQKRKSILLPTGKVAFKHVQAKLLINDPAACLAWANERLPQAVARDPRLLVGVVSEHAAKTGEVPPGAEFLEAGDVFRVGGK